MPGQETSQVELNQGTEWKPLRRFREPGNGFAQRYHPFIKERKF